MQGPDIHSDYGLYFMALHSLEIIQLREEPR